MFDKVLNMPLIKITDFIPSQELFDVSFSFPLQYEDDDIYVSLATSM